MEKTIKISALRDRVKSCIGYRELADKLKWPYWKVKEKLGGFAQIYHEDIKAIQKILTREERKK